MTRVRKIDLPIHSQLWSRVGPHDFVDCYTVAADMPPRRAAEIITSFPGWAQFLLLIRRWVTTPFGLSNDGREGKDKVGIFPVEIDTEGELIAGFNDRHLDFRVSVLRQGGQVSLATWVHPHNIGGQLYLRMILPFHIMIARDALARVNAAE